MPPAARGALFEKTAPLDPLQKLFIKFFVCNFLLIGSPCHGAWLPEALQIIYNLAIILSVWEVKMVIRKIFLFFVVFSLAVMLCVGEKQKKLPLDSIKLPTGFKIELFAAGVKNARSMSRSPKGTLFVGTRRAGNVYAVIDKDNDYKADEVITIASGMNMPNGMAFRNGSLYVAEIHRVLRLTP
jgi:hypothetical protein